MKTIILFTVIFAPQLAVASFYENCLLIGELKRVENAEEISSIEENTNQYIFVTTSSYTLKGSHRNCDYWHGRNIDVTSELKSHSNYMGKKSLALHYSHHSGLCEGGKACGSKVYTVAPHM